MERTKIINTRGGKRLLWRRDRLKVSYLNRPRCYMCRGLYC